MKKQDSKRIILSVLLGSMMWSNSLYAYTLTENISEDDIDKNTNFEEVIIAGNETGIYQPANGEKLTISGVSTAVNFTSVENVVEKSKIYGTITGSIFGDENNKNNLIIKNSEVSDVFGGANGSDNSFNTVTLINSKSDQRGDAVAGASYRYVEEMNNIVNKINTTHNTVNINSGNVENVFGSMVTLEDICVPEVEIVGNTINIDSLGEFDRNMDKYENIALVSGGTLASDDEKVVSGVKWNNSFNRVNINNSYLTIEDNYYPMGIYGAVVEVNGNKSFTGEIKANNNYVEIKNSDIIADGSNEKIGIYGGFVSEVSEHFEGKTSADYNIINIYNSMVVAPITAGRDDLGQANGNTIIIENNSFIVGTEATGIIGGYSKNASNNTIKLNGNSAIGSHLYGWYEDNNANTGIHENNVLKVNDFNSSIKGIHNFNTILFETVNWNTEPVFNNVYNTGDKWMTSYGNGGILTTDISNIGAVELGNLSDTDLKIGDKAYLIFAQFDSKNSENNENNKNELKKLSSVNGGNIESYVGVAKVVNSKFLYEDNVDVISKNITDGEVQNETSVDTAALSAVVTGVERNPQTDLVASNRAVAAAFVNQGTDLIADSLDTLSRDGKYGVKTFAAVHGNRSKYDVNSDIKINGWSTIVGVGSETEHNGGDFSWGVFYENGSGNYRTFNSFNNEYFRGDGSLVYNGGGIAARYENAHGVYTEGSLRAGMLKSDMDNALSDGENKYGYSSESEYYGAHIGIGQIIPLSESSDLDVYGKFFHNYTEGDSFKVDTDEFEFDSINSDRLRVGARLTTNKENKFSTYYGLAYEYEFNGDAEMRAAGMSAPTQSLQGSSYMAEVGFNYQPTPESPWSFDLNMRGYAGEREGATFNVQATYTF